MLDSKKKKGWQLEMLLPSYRNCLIISVIGLSLGVVGWTRPAESGAPQDGPQVSITPRPKPSPTPSGLETLARSSIRTDVNLVLIPVTVTDPLNRFVTGLERESFKIFEDKKQQQISTFSSEDAPLSVGVLFDCSGSMGPQKLRNARAAVAQFLGTANPDDEAFLVQFSENAELVQSFTHGLGDIQNKLQFTQSKGSTALFDAIYLGLHEMKRAKNTRKALLVISDGGDNNSRYTESEIRKLVKESDVQLYAIGIYESMGARGRTAEEMNGPALMTELTEVTGGRHYQADNINELPDIAAKIGMELRNQYMLGYQPQNQQRDGRYRKVEVKLVQPRGMPALRAFFRMGYNAPAQ